MKLTDEQKTKYLDNPSKCPYCGSDVEAVGGVDVDGTLGTQPICCISCDKTWQDVYRLVGIYEQEEE